jgi:hypothetical protein
VDTANQFPVDTANQFPVDTANQFPADTANLCPQDMVATDGNNIQMLKSTQKKMLEGI